MNLNASIIDQRLDGVQNEIQEWARDELSVVDAGRLRPLAFVYLCVKTMLDLEPREAFDCLTEGGGDFGVDAMQVTEEVDGEFAVTVFQAKYKAKLDADANFPEAGIVALIGAIRHIFDPTAELGAINDRMRAKVDEARSLVRDGFIPRVRAVACNNGLKWTEQAQKLIELAGFGDQVTWEHVNHDVLIGILQRPKQVDVTLRLVGRANVEDMNFSRVCIGRMPVTEVASLMEAHGDRLLESNIRRYLGLHGNRVNEGIRETLGSPNPSNFYFFNNGLTLVCTDFTHNALQSSDYQVRVENLQIVNGGQTCMTILKTAQWLSEQGRSLPADASVLVRLYKLPRGNEDIVLQITHATNSQNPVDLKDLKSNDEIQIQLEASIQSLGFNYRRKRTDGSSRPTDITAGAAAEALLAVWREAPHQAKFLTREHFGKLYRTVFPADVNGAQVLLAVLLYRIAENHRRRPTSDDPSLVRYASCFIAMRMGQRLLKDLGLHLEAVGHQCFSKAQQLIEAKGEVYFRDSVGDIQVALTDLYGEKTISTLQLSATFRRGDLIHKLLALPV
jgi:hypothetical protein